ncbi:MAG: hypothetical protein EPO64_05970 [Nitrospirae bacterium]|nr:MAG: hypothetical protein EPO64_05970 [Nitrospirota bacterium]
MSKHRGALQAATFFALLMVSNPALAQVGSPAQESDRDASSTEDGPSLGQSQQNQTKGQQQQRHDAGGDLRQDQTDGKDNRQDRSSPRAERPPRQDRPMKPERFHK